MFIKVTDIPPEGLYLEFPIDEGRLNERLNPQADIGTKSAAGYYFAPPINARLKLRLEGSIVVIHGHSDGDYIASCARCVEETKQHVDIPVDMLLKPRTERGPDAARDEDVSFGFYDGQEVNCAAIIEELLILALPFSVICDEKCRGLCPVCGANLNTESCSCKKNEMGDERFALLRNLKLTSKE